jgi:hypothetical protein
MDNTSAQGASKILVLHRLYALFRTSIPHFPLVYTNLSLWKSIVKKTCFYLILYRTLWKSILSFFTATQFCIEIVKRIYSW